MSDCNSTQDFSSTFDNTSSKLCICLFSIQPQFIRSIKQLLYSDRSSTDRGDFSAANSCVLSVKKHDYELKSFSLAEKLIEFVRQNEKHIDCLILNNSDRLALIVDKLQQLDILLPIVIVETEKYVEAIAESKNEFAPSLTDNFDDSCLYHCAEIRLYPTHLPEINSYIGLAIAKFINLIPDVVNNCEIAKNKPNLSKAIKKSLTTQQHRLKNKLKAKLGLSDISSYKRDTNNFYRNLPIEKREKLHHKLIDSYRQILLIYFEDDAPMNKLIDEFVDLAFFADISTSKIIEIHMELIDNFAYQLKIEGRSDDILIDYRLPLIDIISHVCEMYRRSIPQENTFELLFGVK